MKQISFILVLALLFTLTGCTSPSTKPTDLPETPVTDFSYDYDAELQGVVIKGYKGKDSLTVRIPDTIEGDPVVGIGSKAFIHKNVKEVYLPNTIKDIARNAFENSEITSFYVPASVESIDYRAFVFCKGLTHIDVDKDNQAFTEIDGILFSKDKSSLILYPAGRTGAYSVPDGVVKIDYGAFCDHEGITSITLPNSLKYIGEIAFARCTGLSSIVLPNSVIDIEHSAFGFCTGLISVELGTGVSNIGRGAFGECENLTSITIPDSITAIEQGTFYMCKSLDNATKQRIHEINPNYNFD